MHFAVVQAADPSLLDLIVDSPGAITRLRSQGAVLLPVELELLRGLNLGGYVRRNWGPEGWRFEVSDGRRLGSPVAIEVVPGRPFLHWAAGVRALKDDAHGSLRLVSVPSSTGLMPAVGLSIEAVDCNYDATQGKVSVLSGICRFETLDPRIFGLGLSGVCHEVAVDWIAVSQASTK